MEKHKLEYAKSQKPPLPSTTESLTLENAEWNSTTLHRASDGRSEGAVDAILCPAGPGVAPSLDCSRYWGYTSQRNLLDYPALAFPVSEVGPDVDVREEGYRSRTGTITIFVSMSIFFGVNLTFSL